MKQNKTQPTTEQKRNNQSSPTTSSSQHEKSDKATSVLSRLQLQWNGCGMRLETI
jgi:hypothetical protein